MFIAATIALVVAILMALARGLLGPTLFDRVLATNAIGTKIVLLIAVVGFLTDRPAFLDLAVTYALINFIATVAILKLLRVGHLRSITPEDAAEEEARRGSGRGDAAALRSGPPGAKTPKGTRP
ncbi:cation:proton antiporter [Tistrella sp. BH-R2-4]|uniref:Cation:proton antiporter n=1 Tax=Tistrella arctica TaxID=3133430 RepID=A0ABU9YIX2_9PROT